MTLGGATLSEGVLSLGGVMHLNDNALFLRGTSTMRTIWPIQAPWTGRCSSGTPGGGNLRQHRHDGGDDDGMGRRW